MRNERGAGGTDATAKMMSPDLLKAPDVAASVCPGDQRLLAITPLTRCLEPNAKG